MPTLIKMGVHHTNHSVLEDILVLFKGFSWLALVTFPWTLLALLGHLTGIVYLSMDELIFVAVLLIAALPQLIYCSQK